MVGVVPFEVGVPIDEVLNGACWGTFRFVMLRDIGAEGPEYPHRIGLIPHVNISPMPTKIKLGVVLAGTELLVLDAGVGVVGVVIMDPGRLMVDEGVEDETERPSELKVYDKGRRED